MIKSIHDKTLYDYGGAIEVQALDKKDTYTDLFYSNLIIKVMLFCDVMTIIENIPPAI